MSGPENEESLERFFSRVQPTLRATLARYSVPAGEAEALLKDVLLTLVYKRNSIASPERWLVQTVRHRCLTFWRRRRWQLYSRLDSALLEATAEPARAPGLAQELDSVVGTLPRQCKGLLRDRYGLSEEGGARNPSPESSELEGCLAALGRRLAERGALEPSQHESG
ncbi:MAG: sigma-70 family RNA polymerase sigma factor [Acidobacteria bacterium]|nr:sigma-70 family RNA polymerase sigma factor [Acidobacteriota bacterium]